MLRMGRPRQTRKDLPPGLRWSDVKGYFYYGTKVADGKRPYKHIGKVTRDEAIKVWVKIHNSVPDESPDGTVGALIDRYAREVLPKKRESTRIQYEKQTVKLRELFGSRKYCQHESQVLTDGYLRRMHVQQYVSNSESPIMANRFLALLSSIFRYACNMGMTEYNPCLGVQKNKETARDRHLERLEIVALQRAAHQAPMMRLIMLFGRITSMRECDILSLKKSQIKDGYIYSAHKKNGAQRLYKITWAVRLILKAAHSQSGSLTSMNVFHNRKGQQYTGDGFRSNFSKIVKKSGLTNVHFHDFRARGISDADRMGRDGFKLSGNSSREMTKRVYGDRAPSKVVPNK